MYGFIDQKVNRLQNDGRFLLWAMRAWHISALRKDDPQLALADGFLGYSVSAALPHFHAAMSLLCGQPTLTVNLLPMGCQRIGEWDAVFLNLWSDFASGYDRKACATLALLVSADAVDVVAHHMVAALKQLEKAGLLVSNLSLLSFEEPGS